MRRTILVLAFTIAGLVDAAAQKAPIATRPPSVERISPGLASPPARTEDRAIHPPGAGAMRQRPFDITNNTAATTIAEGVRARVQNTALCDAIPLEVAPAGGLRTLETTQFPCLRWRETVAWIGPDGARSSYDHWPAARKTRLEQLYRAILTDQPDLGVACPASPTPPATLTEQQAEDIYLVHVAHALALEHKRTVPWRLWRLPAAELAVLLGPEHHVWRRRGTDGRHLDYRLWPQGSSALAFDCDPRVGLRFLQAVRPNRTEPLLGATEEETLRRITLWFRDEVGHGGYSEPETLAHAHLADRLTRYQSFTPPPLVSFWAVKGCHSAGPLFVDLARSANIPVLSVARGATPGQTTGHAALVFRWAREGTRVLQHVDDIYAEEPLVFPLSADGRAATPTESDRRYFDAHWLSPDQLRAHGFEFGLAELFTGPPGAEYTAGWTIGWWRAGVSRATPEGRIEELAAQFELVKQYELVSGGAVQRYCQFGWRTPENWDDFIATASGRPTRQPVTAAQMFERVRDAVDAYGGCEAVMAAKARFDAFKGRPAGS